jgi:hypothetical protein
MLEQMRQYLPYEDPRRYSIVSLALPRVTMEFKFERWTVCLLLLYAFPPVRLDYPANACYVGMREGKKSNAVASVERDGCEGGFEWGVC